MKQREYVLPPVKSLKDFDKYVPKLTYKQPKKLFKNLSFKFPLILSIEIDELRKNPNWKYNTQQDTIIQLLKLGLEKRNEIGLTIYDGTPNYYSVKRANRKSFINSLPKDQRDFIRGGQNYEKKFTKYLEKQIGYKSKKKSLLVD